MQRNEIVAKVFPEITLKGSGVDLKLYAIDHESDSNFNDPATKTELTVLIDDGYSKVALAHVKTYDESTEVIQVVMQGFAALGYDLDSVN